MELNDSTKSGGGMINYTGRETGRGKEEERSRGTTDSAKQFREKGSERPSKLTAGTKLFKRERLFPRPDTNYVPFQFPPFPPPTDLFFAAPFISLRKRPPLSVGGKRRSGGDQPGQIAFNIPFLKAIGLPQPVGTFGFYKRGFARALIQEAPK